MKKTALILIITTTVVTVVVPAYASDWDKFGKIMAGIEGVRILSGGRVDILGTITGINDNNDCGGRISTVSCRRVWVPRNVVWKKVYVPQHKEHHPKYGKVIVEGHYIKYKVVRGGYWR